MFTQNSFNHIHVNDILVFLAKSSKALDDLLKHFKKGDCIDNFSLQHITRVITYHKLSFLKRENCMNRTVNFSPVLGMCFSFQNIAENRLGRDGADAISEMLYKNEFLKSLNMSGKFEHMTCAVV